MSPRLPSLIAGALAGASLLLLPACGGGGIGPDTREPYAAVMIPLDGFLQNGTTWTLPGVARPESAALDPYNGLPEVTTCNTDDLTNGRAIDGVCSSASRCQVETGYSVYDTRLGFFSVRFINNQSVAEDIIVEGFGFNIRVLDAAGKEVWNMLVDHGDLVDVQEEIGHLQAGGADCSAGVDVIVSEPFSMYRTFNALAVLYGVGNQSRFTLGAGRILDTAVAWDGRDRDGNVVSPGTYTVHVDVKVRDPDTGLAWKSPPPATLIIAPAPSS
jgi:hypothetical protein